MNNTKIISLILILILIVIIVVILNVKSYGSLKSIKSRDIIAPPSGAKPWCMDLIYTFTVSGSTTETRLMVPKSMTATYPRIKLTEDGNILKDDTIINVKKNMALPGIAGALTPLGVPLSSYSIKKGDLVIGKYGLDNESIFTDYDNPCQTDFKLEIIPDIKLTTDTNFTDKPLYAVNEYTLTFFTRSNLSGASVKATYAPTPSLRANGSVEYFKPAFTVVNMYGIDGLRIERKDKVLKEQYKDFDPNQIELTPIQSIPFAYKLIDKNPLERLPQAQLKAVFNNFNNSFI